MKFKALHVFKLVHFLSLDVAFGSCAFSLLIHQYLHINAPFFIYTLLFLAVFAIYLSDHLLDQLKIKSQALSERRLFYRSNQYLLLGILVAAIVIGGFVAIVFLQFHILIAGLIFILFILIYLIASKVNNHLLLPKELLIALLYTFGTAFYSIQTISANFSISFWSILLIIFFIALENLLIYSILDFEEDKKYHFTSFPIQFGLSFCELVLFCCFIANFVLLAALFLMLECELKFILVLCIIHITHIILYFTRHLFKQIVTIRMIADGIFSAPLFLLFT